MTIRGLKVEMRDWKAACRLGMICCFLASRARPSAGPVS